MKRGVHTILLTFDNNLTQKLSTMKTKTILIALIAMLAVTALIFQSCKKDDKPGSQTPPIYTNGQGEIGLIGGTVKIEDPSSPINGASIVIPEGALSNNTTISIVPAPESVNFPGDSTLQLIAFQPEGLEFEKPVQITLPFNGEDMQKARVYYYDEGNDIVSEMPLINTNQANKQVVFETNHFSYYTACEYIMSMKMKMVYNNQALKIGAKVYIDGWWIYQLGPGTFYPGFYMTHIKYKYWINYGSTVEYVVRNTDIPLYSHFTVKLYDGDFFFSFKRKIELYVKREKVGDSFTASVYKYDESGVIYNTDVIEYNGEEGLETWFTGKPLIFYFDDFEFNPDDEYWIKTEWHMAKESDGSPSFTSKFELNNKEDKRKPRDMEHISNADIYNNYIDSEYVDGGGSNTPPTALFTVSPSSGTTSTNFAFDASGSTDNEDPTSNLQVRWDFDGNDSWDTGWDTDKTENHQYGSEATYTAKLEVKDTEGLTDQYTKSITVNNSGGGSGCGSLANLQYGGQTYEIVEIGNQCWMAENLNYPTTDSWWYDNSSANGYVYGRLYKWEAAITACPSGWHLPSDDEWKIMEMSLGMSQNQANSDGYRGTDEGSKMKEIGTTHWASPNPDATNSSGFTALPGGSFGHPAPSVSFFGLGIYSFWWTSTEKYGNHPWLRRLDSDEERIRRMSDEHYHAHSVRCLKD